MKNQILDRPAGWWTTALVAFATLFALAALGGCEAGDTGVFEPTVSEARIAQAKTLPELVPTEAMTAAIQDEYRAQATYAKVLVDFGEVKPFVSIVGAEARHVQAVARLFTINALEVPASEWNEGNVPVFESLAAACAAAVAGETANVALYDQLLLLTLPENVRKVFERLRAASLLRHLSAFGRCV